MHMPSQEGRNEELQILGSEKESLTGIVSRIIAQLYDQMVQMIIYLACAFS
jgi:hypothetical protein